jgi:hypothetical protein
MPVRPPVRSLPAVAALALLGLGCTGGLEPSESQLLDARRRWDAANVRSYSMVLARAEGTGVPDPVRVTVVNGAVTSRVYVETNAPVPAADAAKFPAVEGLFDLVQDAFNRAGAVSVSFDSTYGFPVSIVIDWVLRTIEDNLSVAVSQFTPAS